LLLGLEGFAQLPQRRQGRFRLAQVMPGDRLQQRGDLVDLAIGLPAGTLEQELQGPLRAREVHQHGEVGEIRDLGAAADQRRGRHQDAALPIANRKRRDRFAVGVAEHVRLGAARKKGIDVDSE
jgi:hypothetical protein